MGWGAGLVSGKRVRLRRVLSDPGAMVIVVEGRGRLARFGAEHLAVALAAQGRRVVVAVPCDANGDLVRDVTGVFTWRCAAVRQAWCPRPGRAQ